MSDTTVRWVDLRPRDDASAVEAAIRRVIEAGWFVLGPEGDAFETEFAEATNGGRTVGVASGTDALTLTLRALGIGTGDEVITTALSAVYSAQAIVMAGARPVFADIDPDRLTLDPAAVEALVGPSTAAIIPVHLYGQPADLPALAKVADRHGLAIVEDCCQAHLATCCETPVGTACVAAAYSFYPTKNLGALGDGGAVTTRDSQLEARLRRLRNGGQTARNQHTDLSAHSRLDEIQAAILRARLPLLPSWTARRRTIAAQYRDGLTNAPVLVPATLDTGHVYHLFPIRTTGRDAFQEHLRNLAVETLVHYPVPIPAQPAFAFANPAPCPIATTVCNELVSLPLYPGLRDAEVAQVIEAVCTAPATGSL